MINIVNFIKALKGSWIRRLIRDHNKPWIKLYINNFGQTTNISTRGANWFKTLADRTTNKFWKDTFYSYIDILIKNRPRSNEDILSTPLWYNRDISDYKLFQNLGQN